MTAVKERIMGAVTLMNDQDAEKIWNLIQSHFVIFSKGWDDIEEVVPDQTDLFMLKEIEDDPDCHEFVSSEDVRKELGI